MIKPHRFEVTLEKNKLPDFVGELVKNNLRTYGYTLKYPKNWVWDWNVEDKKSKYVGSLSKRLGKLGYQQHMSLDTGILADIVNRAAEFVVTANTTHFCSISRVFRWREGAYGDRGSCFWHGRGAARHMLKENGAFSLRFFRNDTYDDMCNAGLGRGWLIPLAHGMALINVYGLRAAMAARVLQQHFGASDVRQLECYNNGSGYGTLFINQNRCWYLHTDPDARIPSSVLIAWPEMHGGASSCNGCGNYTVRRDHYSYRCGGFYCRNCLKQFARCRICGLWGRTSEMLQPRIKYMHHECAPVEQTPVRRRSRRTPVCA